MNTSPENSTTTPESGLAVSSCENSIYFVRENE